MLRALDTRVPPAKTPPSTPPKTPSKTPPSKSASDGHVPPDGHVPQKGVSDAAEKGESDEATKANNIESIESAEDEEESMVVTPKAKNDLMELKAKNDLMELADSKGRPSTVEEEPDSNTGGQEESGQEVPMAMEEEPDSNTGGQEVPMAMEPKNIEWGESVEPKATDPMEEGSKESDSNTQEESVVGKDAKKKESVVVASQANELEQMNPDANADKKESIKPRAKREPANAKRKKNEHSTHEKTVHEEKQKISELAKSIAKAEGIKPREAQKRIDAAS